MLKSLLYNFTCNQELEIPKKTQDKSGTCFNSIKYFRRNHARYSSESSQPILKDVPRVSASLKNSFADAILPGYIYSEHSKCLFIKSNDKPRRLARLDRNEYSYIAKRGSSYRNKPTSSKRSLKRECSYEFHKQDRQLSLMASTPEHPASTRVLPLALKPKEEAKEEFKEEPKQTQPTHHPASLPVSEPEPDSAHSSLSPEQISGCAKVLRGKMTKMGRKVLRTINTIEKTSSQIQFEELAGWEFDNSWDME